MGWSLIRKNHYDVEVVECDSLHLVQDFDLHNIFYSHIIRMNLCWHQSLWHWIWHYVTLFVFARITKFSTVLLLSWPFGENCNLSNISEFLIMHQKPFSQLDIISTIFFQAFHLFLDWFMYGFDTTLIHTNCIGVFNEINSYMCIREWCQKGYSRLKQSGLLVFM